MDNVNFDAKTDWKLNDIVMPADANRWEEGIDDTAKLANHLNESKLDVGKADEEFKDKADINLKNTRFLTNCIIGSKNGIVKYSLGKKGNYTIIGKPTISSSQFVSNIDANNRVTADIEFPVPTETLLVEGRIQTPAAWSDQQVFVHISNANGYGLDIRATAEGKFNLLLSSNGSSWNLYNGTTTYIIPNNASINFKLYWNKYQYFLMVQEAGESSYKTVLDVNNPAAVCATTKVHFGTNENGSYPLKGSLFLNNYSISVDGQRVLSSTNAIPIKDVTITSAGIASGFKYGTNSTLTLDKSDVVPTSSFELATKFKMNSLASACMMFDSLNGTTLQLRVNTAGTIHLWVGNGSSYNSLNEALVSTAIQVNKWYWLKLIWTGSLWILFLSEDGKTYNTYQAWFSENQPIVTKTNIFFGYDKGYGYEFNGDIDLNETYVKVDGSVVTGANFINSGCTVENGVASKFAATARICTDKKLIAPTKNLIYKFKFHTPTVWTARTRQFFLGQEVQGLHTCLIYVSNGGVPLCYMQTGTGNSWNIMENYEFCSNGSQFILPTDSDVWLKLIWEGTGYIPQISTDGVNFKTGRRLANTAHHNTMIPCFGNLQWNSAEYFDGKIDLKETSFKINGDYKFNGANLITMNEAKIENGVLSFPVPQNMNGAFYPKRTPAEAANSWEIIVNVHTPDSAYISRDLAILGNAQTAHAKIHIYNNKLQLAYANAARITGTTAILPDTDYWVGLKFDGTGYELYEMVDDGSFTLDSLPEFSSWVKEGSTYALTTDIFKDIMFTLGYTWEDNTYLYGSINLAKTRIKRNGEVFWQWNEKDGDNVDLIDYEDGWVFNGKPEQNQFELSGDKAWEWDKVNTLNPKLLGGQIWDLVNPITGTVTIKEGVTALIKKGYSGDKLIANLYKIIDKDSNIVIPYVQSGDYIAYIDAAGVIRTAETMGTELPEDRAELARFIIEDYVLKAVSEKQVVSIPTVNTLSDLLARLGPDYSAAVSLSSNVSFTAPCTGWIMGYSGSGDLQMTSLYVGSTAFLYTGRKSYNTGSSICVFVAKGQTITPRADSVLRFIPILDYKYENYR